MYLIVGLGNKGEEYNNTRHNLGFYFLDNYLEKKQLKIFKSKFNGLYIKEQINGEDVIFLKPQTYMNLSGEAVKEFVNYYKINIENILIINDDLDLPVGEIRLREKGTSGGHNGLKNIEENLKTQNYKRLKIGIGNNKLINGADYVLGKISIDDQETYKKLVPKISNIIDDFLKFDFDKLMNKYNIKKDG